MHPKRKVLIEELKNLHAAFSRVGMIWDELQEENDPILDEADGYPFDGAFEDVTADVADWIEGVMEQIEE